MSDATMLACTAFRPPAETELLSLRQTDDGRYQVWVGNRVMPEHLPRPTPVAVGLLESDACDPEVHLFFRRGRAEQWARDKGHELDRGDYYHEDDSDAQLVVSYGAQYECRISVFDAEVDADA